jgi:hypothetical protein
MSESRAFEVYECQSYSRAAKWQPHGEIPWATKDPPAPCLPLHEITLPNDEWVWTSEWMVVKRPGATDEGGWEYASRISRFLAENRPPKAEAHQWSTVRRRLWTRSMRREMGIRTADIPKALLKIQTSLASIHGARVRIEEITKQSPQAAQNEQMVALIQHVKKNIGDVISSLDQISAHLHKNGSPSPTTTAAVKKLRNDVVKEDVGSPYPLTLLSYRSFLLCLFSQAAIDRAVSPDKTSPRLNANRDFQRLQQKGQSHSFGESRALGGAGKPPVQRGSSFAATTALNSTRMPTLNELNEANFKMESRGAGGVTGVKSGRADTFNPSVFQSANSASGEGEQGLFVDRNKRELQISEVRLAGARLCGSELALS